ncbi:hypothetical protein M422DRAFT_70835 [Sphaerobolus stellatus SS14]|uniref:Uncharacterized protein n=1 Tax=Sphaerobolus stellatus (strain SS14) TaxID=990650 RepID=A0A0C9V2G6_SPHS4|nr:hypothetical protein M422DRAFT_70835 [Sphaerobolus stellatus SS14]
MSTFPNTRAQFENIFDGLPAEAQRQFLQDQVFPLLSLNQQSKLLNQIEDTKKRFRKLPQLDLAAKKAEIDALFVEIRRDSHRHTSTSIRADISGEIIEGISAWMSEIWQTVFEFAVEFDLAHRCLLFASETLHKLMHTGCGCNCILMSMHIYVQIRDSHGKVVKEFSNTGANKLDNVFLWVWRDLLLKMLSSSQALSKLAIPRMLQEIQTATRDPATALYRLLCCVSSTSEDDDDLYSDTFSSCSVDDEVNVSATDPSKASYWDIEMASNLARLRLHITDTLLDTFKTSPSFSLFRTLSILRSLCLVDVIPFLEESVPCSSQAAVAALDIFTYADLPDRVISVFDQARTVFRPRDAEQMGDAVGFLLTKKLFKPAFEVIERELQDTVVSIRSAVLAAFPRIDTPAAKKLWDEEVQGKRAGSNDRKNGIESWMDAIVRVGQPPNPLHFAAMLMGLPTGFDPEDTEEQDPFIFSNIKEDHPDYEDLRETWRPQLRQRFQKWTGQAEMAKKSQGGLKILDETEKDIKEQLPWLQFSDVVEEMINRLQDVASKFFVCEALEAISSFMASQRRRAIAARARAERAKSKQNGNPKKSPITGRHSRADRARPSSSFGAGPSSSGLGPSSSAAGPSGASTSTAQPTPTVTRTVPPPMPPFGDESDDEDFMPALMFDFPKPGLEDLD